MKIFIIDLYYSRFLDNFYEKCPEMINKNYEQQKKTLFSECFGTADFFSKNLKKLGHQAKEIILNNEILQKQWAKEHKTKYFKGYFKNFPKLNKYFLSNWEEKILEEQIKEFAPDIIYCQSVYKPGKKFLNKIKKYTKLTVAQTAYKLPNKKYFEPYEPYDLIISSLPNQVQLFRDLGKNSEYLKLAFESTILNKVKKFKNGYNVTHIGGYGSIHNERNEVLEKVAKKINTDFWGYSIDNLNENSIIRKTYCGEKWGIDMYNILYNSKITLTKHIEKVAGDYANNMTLYEATGCGCLLITDFKNNLGDIFEIGKEIETYKSSDELIEKIQYYLTHEDERKKIVEAGQKRTLKDHTYEIRMKELMDIFNKYL